MISFTFFLTAFAVSWLTVHAIFEDHPCETGQFKVLGKNAESFIRCQTCYMCPPGYGVHKECSETSDTVCRACPSGYFSDSSTRRGGCQKCRPCLDDADTVRECTPNSNRECRLTCSPGDYLDRENRRCMSCSLCHQTSNVRVTRNEQCLSQRLPRDWVCSSNITLMDEEGNAINTLDTGDTYSYKEVSRKRHRTGAIYNDDFFPSLEDFIADHRAVTVERTSSETTTSLEVEDSWVSESIIRRAASSTNSPTSRGSPKIHESAPEVTMMAENGLRVAMATNVNIIWTSLPTAIISLILLVVVIMQRRKIGKLEEKTNFAQSKSSGFLRNQVSHEEHELTLRRAWED